MPVYTYRCENCGVQFEQTQKFTDNPLTVCPECGFPALHKVYQPVGIVFKGSGFYATDHRSPSGAPRTHSTHTEEKSSSSEDKADVKVKDTAKPAESKVSNSESSNNSE